MSFEEILGKLLGLDNDKIPLLKGFPLDWNNLPPTWVILIAITAILFVTSFIYSGNRLVSTQKARVLLTLFRVCAFLTILAIIFEPILAIEVVEQRRSSIVILVDVSESMKKIDEYPEDEQVKKLRELLQLEQFKNYSRLDLIKTALSKTFKDTIEDLQKKWNIKAYTFGKGLKDLDLDKLNSAEARDQETAIGDAIFDALKRSKDELVNAVILFTDGQNNSGRDPLNVILENKQLQVLGVIPGIERPVYDLAIEEIKIPEYSYSGDEVIANTRLFSEGYESGNVALTVFKTKTRDESEVLSLNPDDLEKTISAADHVTKIDLSINELKFHLNKAVTISFDEEGTYHIIFKLEKKKGELSYVNNYSVKKIKILDNTIKVLLVDYRPRLEFLYLKAALQRDKTVLFHSLLLDADYDFPQEYSNPAIFDENKIKKYERFFRPLERFPETLDEYLEYDVIIFGDMNLNDLTITDPAKAISDFVRYVDEFGGGIIFIAGSRGNPETFSNTQIENILPVVPLTSYEQQSVNNDDFEFALTSGGNKSAVLRVKADDQENKRTWEEPNNFYGIRPVRWVKKVKNTKPASTTLLNVKGEGIDSELPVLVWQHYGRGRSVYVASDDFWYSLRYFKGDNPFYYVFWRQMLQWCREGKLKGSKRFYILLDNPIKEYKLGEKVTIEVKAYDENYLPLSKDQLNIDLTTPSSGKRDIILAKEKEGVFKNEYTPESPGEYKITISESDDSINETFNVV
ncbi:MAG: VWA domain-containing protein, partial [Planctomycetes bacterium]|nr:VWA domain-containing protein [Planctomycetota bacterium]